jgi:hypothetical protein
VTDQPNGKGAILSLDAARSNGIRKGNDFITVQQAYDMVIQECAKVHEHYLTQIPNHVATMSMDALVGYGLIKPIENPDIPLAGSPDNIKAEEPAEQVSGDAESTPAPVVQPT